LRLGISRLTSTQTGENSLDFNKIINRSLRVFLKDVLRAVFRHPSQASFFLRTLNWQREASKTRAKFEREGVHIPPILVFSVTSKCNLHCKGCYHQTLRASDKAEITDERLERVIAEARELGISFIVLGGGEPLMRSRILDVAGSYPDVMFLMFTNGLLLDDSVIEKMAEKRNIIPLVSMEGYQNDTDYRRGAGVYDRVLESISRLKEKGIFWGTSLTMTRLNFDEVTDESFIKELVNAGCKLFMFVEYTPVKEGTEDWVLTEEQRSKMIDVRNKFRKKFSAVFIALPWDEEEIGGCLSAGRGFVHVSAEGNVEPCPFVPYSDTNLKDVSLKEALQSKMLSVIRENHRQLQETHGCALWERREWVRSLAGSKTITESETKSKT
jgi:MoaA/NifB/PqqE/SkfB family radical SAM enzyme